MLFKWFNNGKTNNVIFLLYCLYFLTCEKALSITTVIVLQVKNVLWLLNCHFPQTREELQTLNYTEYCNTTQWIDQTQLSVYYLTKTDIKLLFGLVTQSHVKTVCVRGCTL